MFLCKPCHHKMYEDASTMPHFSMSESAGRCEMCDAYAVCWDCHCPPPPALKSNEVSREQQLRELREEFLREVRE